MDPVYPIQRAEDVYLHHCYCYYVLAISRMPDTEFDMMHKYFKGLYPDSPVLNWVGSDRPEDYPFYIREFRRPHEDERRY